MTGAFTVVAAVCAVAMVLAGALSPPAALRLAPLLPSPRRAGRSTLRAAGARSVPWIRRMRSRRSRPAAWRAVTIELCDGFAAELAAGRTPEAALQQAADVLDGSASASLAPVLAAARYGGDVAAALEQAANQSGAEGLRLLAACWRIGIDRGGALAAVVDGLAASLRDAEVCRDEIGAQLAGPRATARLLALLPLLGLAMAAVMGVRPLDFLFGSWPGYVCLAAAACLNVVGVRWTARIARTAEEAT